MSQFLRNLRPVGIGRISASNRLVLSSDKASIKRISMFRGLVIFVLHIMDTYQPCYRFLQTRCMDETRNTCKDHDWIYDINALQF